MKDYILYMDVSGDVDFARAEAGGVKFLPMTMLVGDDETVCDGLDGADKLKAFYDGIAAGKVVKTSQITPFVYEESFAPILKTGRDVLYLCLSSGLSATYSSACEAAKNLEKTCPEARLYPVDSRSATGGMGILMERMIDNKIKGMTVVENKADVEAYRKKVFMNCYVDDLMHLKRGGRIGAATAVVGKMLGIKPLILITEEGKLENFSKARGEKKAIRAMLDVYISDRDPQSSAPVYICDSDSRETAELLGQMVKEVNPAATVKYKTLSPIIGTHLGPGAVVLCFEKK